MNIMQLSEKLKGMGLGNHERQACLETARDAGVDEALDEARTILRRRKVAMTASKHVLDSIR